MNITKNKVVAIDYTLKDLEGTVIDASEENEPLIYVHGNGYLISGLENALEGKTEGDEFSVQIEPKDAYGEYDDSLIFEVSRTQFPEGAEIQVGQEFEAENGQLVSVKAVSPEKITIDTNHPMAGKTLCFDVKVKTVRDLSEEELAMMTGGGCGGGCGGCSGCGGGDCGDGECGCGGCGN